MDPQEVSLTVKNPPRRRILVELLDPEGEEKPEGRKRNAGKKSEQESPASELVETTSAKHVTSNLRKRNIHHRGRRGAQREEGVEKRKS